MDPSPCEFYPPDNDGQELQVTAAPLVRSVGYGEMRLLEIPRSLVSHFSGAGFVLGSQAIKNEQKKFYSSETNTLF